MKKLINNPRNVVREMLEGLVSITPGQALLADADVIVRSELPPREKRSVALLSGGGSGHEPAHAGYVGPGLLTAAIAGDVFTSPSVDAVLEAIRAAAGPAGAVLIVKNYTGDRLNFGLAAEMARAEGIPVEIVVVADDVALRDTVAKERRRGIAGTVLVHKIAGAAAARGDSLEHVAATARMAARELGTMGVALGACTVPAAGRPGFTLEDDAAELGLGIHGEQGIRRVAMQPADAFVETLLTSVLQDLALPSGARVAVLVNGLGGTPAMELAIVARRALSFLREQGLVVERAFCGNYLTAIEMPGVSLSVLRVDDERLALLDAPASAPAWIADGRIPSRPNILPAPPRGSMAHSTRPGPLTPLLRTKLLRAADALAGAEAELTTLDSATGDGDLGISMVRGATAIRALPEAACATPATMLEATSHALRRAIAGSSGPFYAIGLLRAARQLEAGGSWAKAFREGVHAIAELGGARAGDRTMLDALLPAADAFEAGLARGDSMTVAWNAAIAAAEAGMKATAQMQPRLGRASYLGERAVGHVDAGAAAVLVWMRAIGG